jgi:hypothetical protein
MKINSVTSRKGTVLVIALLTITIMTLICATSLYITSQDTNAGMQTASWQQALTAAESGIDAGIRALNDNGQTGAWTNWVQMSQSGTTLPTTEPAPSATPSPSGAPDSSHYNLLPSSQLSVSFSNTEGATSVSTWVTVDTGGMSKSQDTNNKQWYRIRATGQANLSGPARVSNNRLDNDLRNTIALRFNRKTGSASNLGPFRTIEVIMQPISGGGWARGCTLKSWLSMSGSSIIDSFDSSNVFKSTNHLYDSSKRQSHGDIGTLNTGGNSSDLRSSYVYGNLSYSGGAPKNTDKVQGSISTPFSVTIPATSDPSSQSSSWTTYSGGGSDPPNSGNFYAQHTGTTTYIKINGDLTTSSSGKPLHLVQHDSSGTETMVIWVTGKLTTQGSGNITQDSNINVTWYVGDDVTISGNSYVNNTGYAAYNNIIGYGDDNKVTISSLTTNFIGTINAPAYDVTISGGGSLAGALVANTLTESGGSGLHYDEALGSGGASTTVGNYAFASWFEDNAIPNHKDANGNYVIY